MAQLILYTILILIPLNLLAVYLTIRAGMKRFAGTEDRDETLQLVMQGIGGYLAIVSLVLFGTYIAVLGNINAAFLWTFAVAGMNLFAVLILYAVMGRLMAPSDGTAENTQPDA